MEYNDRSVKCQIDPVQFVCQNTKPALHTEEIVLPVDFVCSSKYGEEPGEASCVSIFFSHSVL